MSQLTSHEALQLTAHFAFTAERMRTADSNFEIRASLYETASRVAFLKAHLLAKNEEICPLLGQTSRRAVFFAA